jgi:hypothetical protein
MTKDEAKEYVKALSRKASQDHDHDAALKFSQAACNIANALCALGAAPADPPAKE